MKAVNNGRVMCIRLAWCNCQRVAESEIHLWETHRLLGLGTQRTNLYRVSALCLPGTRSSQPGERSIRLKSSCDVHSSPEVHHMRNNVPSGADHTGRIPHRSFCSEHQCHSAFRVPNTTFQISNVPQGGTCNFLCRDIPRKAWDMIL